MKKFQRRCQTFEKIADIAAVNCWRDMHLVGVNPNSKWRKASDKKILAQIRIRNRSNDGYACPTFRQPTDCKTGFYNVLKKIWLDSCIGGITTKNLCFVLSAKSLSQTLRRLEGAKLICRDESGNSIKWKVSELGNAYLNALWKEFIVD